METTSILDEVIRRTSRRITPHKTMLSKMDYAEIKQSLEEQEEAIRRHNEQVSLKSAEALLIHRENYLQSVIDRQRHQISRALEALHRGNRDDAKRILEAM